MSKLRKERAGRRFSGRVVGALVTTLLLALLLAACAARMERLEEQVEGVVGVAVEALPASGIAAPQLAATAPISDVPAVATLFVTPVFSDPFPPEVRPRIIPLAAPLNRRDAEVSGMAWLSDTLVIMPQYTNFADVNTHVWYTLSRSEILAWARGEISGTLTPAPLTVVTNGVPSQIAGYEGFEAIAFDQAGKVYLTAEATANWVTAAWLVQGTVAEDFGSVTLDPTKLAWIEPQSLTLNHSDESLVLTPGEGLFTLYEVNGVDVTTSSPSPLAHTFGRDLTEGAAIPFPFVEYRVTDATALDDAGRFWAINYFFPNDDALATDHDPIADEFGEGRTHAEMPQVERLLEFVWLGDRIERTQTPPVQLELALIARNWEGIVRLEDGDESLGFLIITDQFPDTILAFVPWTPEE